VINYYQALGFDFTKEDYRIAADEFINTYHQVLPNCQLQPYALQMLEYFKNLGFQQIIFSAMEENSLNKTLAQFQLTGYFKHIFGTQNVLAESKLHKLLQLKKAIDQTTQKICYIGDTVHDADAAKELGCPCFLVANGHYDVTRLKATNYPVIADLSYLPQALKPFNVF
jgi:phosphoglycolate phosphatase